MKAYPLVLDLETKKTFREESDPKKLGVTVVAVYNYADQSETIYTEDSIHQLFPLLEHSSYVVGYNITGFDLPVLQGYYPGDISNIPQFDLLEDLRIKIGRRLSLNDMLAATLNVKKTGHGLMAIEYYKEGKWDELKKYCMDDTLLTRDLFDYGAEQSKVYFQNETGKVPVTVEWRKFREPTLLKDNVELTLPF